MAGYSAPLRDMRFVLNHIVDQERLVGIERFADASPDMVDAILSESDKFSSGVMAPLNLTGDQSKAKFGNGVVEMPEGFPEAYGQFVEGQWMGLPFDPDYGGQGLPLVLGIAVQEMWGSANLSLSLFAVLTQGAIEAISFWGTPEQKETYLPDMIAGRWTGTMNLTEPQAGSDVGAVRTRAEAVGDGTYRIKGNKIFITYGDQEMSENIVHLVLARLPDAPPGTRGISCFVVPKYIVAEDGTAGARNDLRCTAIEEKMGTHAAPTCAMAYGDNDECIGYLLGDENKGLRVMFTMMNNARLAVGLEGVAIGERAFQQALEFAVERRQGKAVNDRSPEPNSAIVDHADVRRMLMTMKAYVEAGRALNYINAEAIDLANHHGDEAVRTEYQGIADLLTPINKAWVTDMGFEVASLGVQIHGGMGYIEETGAGQYLRDARIPMIYEGTNGIQAMDLIGRKLPMNGGEVVRDYLGRMAALDADLAALSDHSERGADFAAMRSAFAEVMEALTVATAYMMDQLSGKDGGELNDAAAGAAPYLRMFGCAIGGWLLVRSAVTAQRLLDQGDAADADFLAAKIVTARFFAEQLMPEAIGLLGAATRGAEPLYEISPEMMAAL